MKFKKSIKSNKIIKDQPIFWDTKIKCFGTLTIKKFWNTKNQIKY